MMLPTFVYSAKRAERERLALLARQRDRSAARAIRHSLDSADAIARYEALSLSSL
jgi:hypothetical protein